MLQHLYVKNITLINEISIDFDDKLNILTGETGAGKSIIIGSINIALGNRISKDILRENTSKGIVELYFTVDNKKIISRLTEYGIDCNDREVIISRVINKNGRSVCRINGQIVTVNMLKSVSSLLIDIHGQHEHQSLLDESKHIDLLDQFCVEKIKDKKEKLKILYNKRKDSIVKLKQINMDEHERERKLSLLEYESDEIQKAYLKQNEEEELKEQGKILENAKKLLDGCSEIYNYLEYDSDVRQISCSEQISKSLQILNELKQYDNYFNETYNNLEKVYVWMEDIARDIRDYSDKIDINSEALNEVEKRLDLIYSLKRKYGNTVEEILEYKRKIDQEIQIINNHSIYIENIKCEIRNIEKNMNEVCNEITEIRQKVAVKIEDKITNILKTLQFEHAKFKIQIEKKDNFSLNGLDEVKFLIATNLGEKLKPLSKIVSGGEMSRIMLALKTVLAEYDEIPTLIFDEIDTGISGRTAQKVAEKLVMISKYHQVLCITHLPQIASMADQHLLIEKINENLKSNTQVNLLTDKQIIYELARLLGGAEITEITIKNAKEIKKMAADFKKEL